MSNRRERREIAALYVKMRIIETCASDVTMEAFDRGMRWGLHNALEIAGVHVWDLADAADKWAQVYCVPDCRGCEHPYSCEEAGREIAQRMVE